jgi:hypothetical protein
MSRYHPVRPRKHEQKNEQPQAQRPQLNLPRQEQIDAMAKVADQIYAERNGAMLDSAIARCEHTLAIFDREVARLSETDKEDHRWCISPTVALRWQNELMKLQDRKEALRQECWAMAREIVEDAMRAKAGEDNSLCPPKSAQPAPQADPQADASSSSGPQGGGSASPVGE